MEPLSVAVEAMKLETSNSVIRLPSWERTIGLLCAQAALVGGATEIL